MNTVVRASMAGLVAGVASFVIAASLLGAQPGSATLAGGQNALGDLASSIPAPGTDFIIATLVVVEADGLPADGAMAYVSRRTFNRLRDQAGGDSRCDEPGLRLQVLTGAAAEAWGLPAGAAAILTEVRHGVPVPSTTVMGDGWFPTGVAILQAPCEK